VSSPDIAAVLVEVEPRRASEVLAIMRRWGDISVYTQEEEERLLLHSVVQRSRMLIGLFSVMLTVTAAVIVMMVMLNITIEKTHDLAVLKLMGAPHPRLLGLVLQEAWVLGALGYGAAYLIGELFFPMFPRRVVITPAISLIAPLSTLAVVTLASVLGLSHVMRLDPAQALEG
jgi:putative ABC transport system permease protein